MMITNESYKLFKGFEIHPIRCSVWGVEMMMIVRIVVFPWEQQARMYSVTSALLQPDTGTGTGTGT